MKYAIIFLLGSLLGALTMKYFTPAPPAPVAAIAPPACPEPPVVKAPAKQEEFNYEVYNTLTPSKREIRHEEPVAQASPITQQNLRLRAHRI